MLGSILGAVGSIIGGQSAKKEARRQEKVQREFAQHGIRWKFEDAKAAGLHPLAALGASSASYSPVAVGDLGFASAGQDIGRAIDSTRPASERVDAYTATLQRLQLERGGLENELLRSQIARLRQAGGSGPPMDPGIEQKMLDAAAEKSGEVARALAESASRGVKRLRDYSRQYTPAYPAPLPKQRRR